jgi:hypothetical protein
MLRRIDASSKENTVAVRQSADFATPGPWGPGLNAPEALLSRSRHIKLELEDVFHALGAGGQSPGQQPKEAGGHPGLRGHGSPFLAPQGPAM